MCRTGRAGVGERGWRRNAKAKRERKHVGEAPARGGRRGTCGQREAQEGRWSGTTEGRKRQGEAEGEDDRKPRREERGEGEGRHREQGAEHGDTARKKAGAGEARAETRNPEATGQEERKAVERRGGGKWEEQHGGQARAKAGGKKAGTNL